MLSSLHPSCASWSRCNRSALHPETLNQYRIGRVRIECDSILVTLLSADAAWKTAYRNDLAVLFVRTESDWRPSRDTQMRSASCSISLAQ